MEVEDQAVGIVTDTVSEVVCQSCGCEIDVEGLEPFVRVECPDCSSIETVPTKLGPFLLVSLIGTGGMGGVYLAIDESLGRKVAIKVMLKSLGDDKKFVETFRREAQAVARLNHPNIAQIYSFGQEKGQPYIVMELVDGSHLEKLIEERGKVDQALVMKIGYEIALGLNAANEARLIHGDIKPENILLDEKGKAKLVDFGIAVTAQQGQGEGGIWGTPYYIAPEKIKRQAVDARSDIYSLGATLFHALTGHPPFEGETPIEVIKARIQHPAPRLGSMLRNADKLVESIIARMLEENPNKRYPTYASLLGDLRKASTTMRSGSVTSSGSAPGKSYTVRKKMQGKSRSGSKAPESKSSADISPQVKSRVIIKKKNPSIKQPSASVSTHGKPVSTTGYKPATRKPLPPPKKKSKAGLYVFLTILLLGAAGGAAMAIKNNMDKKKAATRELYFMEMAKNDADTSFKQINKTASRIMTACKNVIDYGTQVSNAVSVVIQGPYSLPKPEIKVGRKASPPEEQTEAPDTSAPKDEKKADPPPIDKSQEEKEKKVNPEDMGVPEGIRLPSEMKGTQGNEPQEPESEKAIEDEPALPEPEPEPEENDPDAKEIKASARKTLIAIWKIEAKGLKTQIHIEDAEKIKQETDAAGTSALRRSKVELLKKIQTDLLAIKEEIKELTKTASDNLKETLETADRVKKERERKAKAIEDAKKQEALEREQAKARIEKEKRIQNEIIRAKSGSAIVLDATSINSYKSTIKDLESELQSYETDEGKAAFQIHIDHAKRLADLKQFLIDKINKSPYLWGWSRGAAARDILAATDKHIEITGAKVPWDKVNAWQMMKMIDYYLSDEQSKTESLATVSQQNLNAAIYCFVKGGFDKAESFAEKAISLRASLEDEVKRLLKREE